MARQSDPFLLRGGLDLVTPFLAVEPGRAITAINVIATDGGYQRAPGYERFDGRPAPSMATNATDRENRRSAIQAVPGAGRLLGAFRMTGDTYAFRRKSAASDVGLYKATAGGWSLQSLGERVEFTACDDDVNVGDTLTKGAVTATIRSIVITSGTLSGGTAAGWFTITGRSGGGFTAGAATATGGGACNLTGAQVTQTLEDILTGGDWFRTIVESFTSTNLGTVAIFCNSSYAYLWDGSYLTRLPQSAGAAIPWKFQNHLFLGLGNGTCRFLALGDPFNSTTTAGAGDLYLGSRVRGAVKVAPETMGVWGRAQVGIISGSSQADFALKLISSDFGGNPDTGQRMAQPLYADVRGVRTIYDVDTSAGYKLGTVSAPISPLFQAWEGLLRDGVNCGPRLSFQSRGLDLYAMGCPRLNADGTTIDAFEMIAGYFGRSTSKPEWTVLDLGINLSGIYTDAGDGTAPRTSTDSVLLAGENGMIYEWGVGNSYDGQPIEVFLRLPFNDAKRARYAKRYHCASVEVESASAITLSIGGSIDVDATERVDLAPESYVTAGGAADWLAAAETGFARTPAQVQDLFFDIDAKGQAISLTITSSTDDDDGDPYTLRAAIVDWSPREQIRRRA